MSKTKLELTWIGKDKRLKLEPRILLEDSSLSYHAKFKRPPRPLALGIVICMSLQRRELEI